MAGTAPFTIGADAICADGACGKLTGVVFDPVAQAATHLVVERHGLELSRSTSPRHQGRSGPLHRGVRQLPAAENTEFARQPQRHGLSPGQVLTMPYYGPADRYGIAAGEGLRPSPTTPCPRAIAVRRGERVHATDGTVGQVQGWSRPGSRHVTTCCCKRGDFGRKKVAILISAVTRPTTTPLSMPHQRNLPTRSLNLPSGVPRRVVTDVRRMRRGSFEPDGRRELASSVAPVAGDGAPDGRMTRTRPMPSSRTRWRAAAGPRWRPRRPVRHTARPGGHRRTRRRPRQQPATGRPAPALAVFRTCWRSGG